MSRNRGIVILLLAAAFALSSCSSASRITYIPDGGAYTEADLGKTLAAAHAGPVAGLSAGEVAGVRQEMLADLRSRDDDAALLADTLTSDFPTDVNAVPFRVESGALDGEPAWIVFEAWGDEGKRLDHTRVWIFSRDDRSLITAKSRF